jgi:L-lactate dehydrogenase complex protein LldG
VAAADAGGIPGTGKADFLRSVQEALGRPSTGSGQAAPPVRPYHRLEEDLPQLEAQAAELEARLRENRPQLLDRFTDMAGKGGWNVHRVSGVEAAIGRVDSLIGELEPEQVVRSGQPVFDDVPVDTVLEWRGIEVTPIVRGETAERERLREVIRHAEVGLTGTDYALAETGSLVIMPRRGLSRLVSLVPPVHIALVRPEEVLDTLHDLFLLRRLEYYRRGGEMGSYLNFITGPSRTADIEMTIVQGVHGPRAVHLILVE